LWILDQNAPGGGSSSSISTSIAGALPAVIVDANSLEESIEGLSVAIDQLAHLMRSVHAVALDSYELEGFAARLEKAIATL
jgi:formiminotetrahydrofolate cyclodeaminase